MRNILIITQKIDKNDPVLGFFHQWIERLSENFEKITVVCLFKGEYNLPNNVKVLSLGKENGRNKWKYIFLFYKYIWRERDNYQSVFVHMNQEYVILGWKFWKLWGKKLFFWRNHKQGSPLTRLAVLVSDKVFYTSPQSFTARFKKSVLMPVGVDTRAFFPQSEVPRLGGGVVMVGRISPVKRVEIFIKALELLLKQGISFQARIIGGPSKKSEVSYSERTISLGGDLVNKKVLIFESAVPYAGTPAIFRRADFFVNTTISGSFDKTIIEAMASGAIPVTSNPAIQPLLSPEDANILLVRDGDSRNLAEKLAYLLTLDSASKEALRERVVLAAQHHSLERLVEKLVTHTNA